MSRAAARRRPAPAARGLWLGAVLVLAPAAFAEVDYRLEALLHQRLEHAEQGDPAAQYRVGDMYLKGRGTPVDHPRARRWLARAAAAGHVKARFKLGYMDLKGLGGEPDPGRALPRIRAAAAAGHPPAQFYLGQMYALGSGLARDSARAVHWIEASLEEGYRPPERELRRIRRVLDGGP